jgi:hypothetical protein
VIIERIKRKIEPGMYILSQSTPVIYFGNYDKAKACTISLNPSDKEFVNNSNILLDNENSERLCSRKNLNKSDNDELTDDEAEIVLRYCTDYFDINPYTNWFNPFDKFINYYGGYSYYDGSCVHLDLVQWATYKKWSNISENIRHKHIESDLPVLKYLLNKNFKIMFLNGITVVNNASECLNIKLDKKGIAYKVNGNNKKLEMYYGSYNNIEVLGWNLNLQRSFSGDEEKRIICDTIKNILK